MLPTRALRLAITAGNFLLSHTGERSETIPAFLKCASVLHALALGFRGSAEKLQRLPSAVTNTHSLDGLDEAASYKSGAKAWRRRACMLVSVYDIMRYTTVQNVTGSARVTGLTLLTRIGPSALI